MIPVHSSLTFLILSFPDQFQVTLLSVLLTSSSHTYFRTVRLRNENTNIVLPAGGITKPTNCAYVMLVYPIPINTIAAVYLFAKKDSCSRLQHYYFAYLH